MIVRNPKNISPLEVSGLNRIAVLVDRSEAAFTEVGLNTWPAGIQGPPHAHTEKEQIFIIVSGTGRIVVGGSTFPVQPHDVVYVPPGVEHQTIAEPEAPVSYLLFNAFLSHAKEGHATFAEHIEKVKATRSAQAAGKASSGAAPSTDKNPAFGRLGKLTGPVRENQWSQILSARQTSRSEVAMVACAPHTRQSVAIPAAEQILFFLTGTGTVQSENETQPVGSGDAIYVPAGAGYATEAAKSGLRYALLSTSVGSQ
jgi:mannose-6-phosphate isomerase-like protein (cupin superfamily)